MMVPEFKIISEYDLSFEILVTMASLGAIGAVAKLLSEFLSFDSWIYGTDPIDTIGSRTF